MARLICGGCQTLLMYTRSATTVRCSCCDTVNLVRPGTDVCVTLSRRSIKFWFFICEHVKIQEYDACSILQKRVPKHHNWHYVVLVIYLLLVYLNQDKLLDWTTLATSQQLALMQSNALLLSYRLSWALSHHAWGWGERIILKESVFLSNYIKQSYHGKYKDNKQINCIFYCLSVCVTIIIEVSFMYAHM